MNPTVNFGQIQLSKLGPRRREITFTGRAEPIRPLQ